MLDFEISLVRSLGWALVDIDETAIESLIPFVRRFAHTGGKAEAPVKYCDQVDGW